MKNKGFSLIELMVTVALAGMLLTIGVPSFATTINNNRMIAAINEFVGAITIARSEAISRRADIVMCKANATLNNCVTTGDWSQGWIIFLDDDDGGDFDSDKDTILQVHEALHQDLSLIGLTSVANLIDIDSRGFSRSTAGNFTLCDTRGVNDAKGVTSSVTTRVARMVDTGTDGIENYPRAGNLTCP